MKLKDIEIGGRYLAKVSGKLQTVRVQELREVNSYRSGRVTTVIHVVNERTQRHLTFRSAQRLRRRVD